MRPAKPQDIGAASALFRASVHGLAAGDYTPEQCRAWAPDVIDAAAWVRRWAARAVWVAAGGDGTLAGFAEAEPDGHLDMLYVHPFAALLGVATRLLAAVEASGRTAGLRCLFTEASLTVRPFL